MWIYVGAMVDHTLVCTVYIYESALSIYIFNHGVTYKVKEARHNIIRINKTFYELDCYIIFQLCVHGYISKLSCNEFATTNTFQYCLF